VNQNYTGKLNLELRIIFREVLDELIKVKASCVDDVTVIPDSSSDFVLWMKIIREQKWKNFVIARKNVHRKSNKTSRKSNQTDSFISYFSFEEKFEFSKWKKFTDKRPKTEVRSQGTLFTYPMLPSFPKMIPKVKKKTSKRAKGNTVTLSDVVAVPTSGAPDVVVSVSEPDTMADIDSVPAFRENDCVSHLKQLRVQNIGNIIIAHQNINSLPNRFDFLVHTIDKNVDILILTETKLDDTFPENQFLINGFKKPYRKDRNKFGGGVMIYVRDDIPSQEKDKFKLPDGVEGIIVEINLRKSKFLLIGTYHSTHENYGTRDDIFLDGIGSAIEYYSSYDQFLIAGDLNLQEGRDTLLDNFLDEFHAKNLVKEPTCDKNSSNLSTVDLFITNTPRSFMKTAAIWADLSDFHKMIITVMRTTFPKAPPTIIKYRDYSKYDSEAFGIDLNTRISNQTIVNYDTFENIFLQTLEKHAPQKSKVVRANSKPYVSKEMRKAIMLRSQLRNKMHLSHEYRIAYKRQRNYCNRLYKRERKKYYTNLNLKNITDNRKFWKTVKPFFTDKGGGMNKFILVENDKIISDDKEVAQTFNDYFDEAVKSLGISENKILLTEPENSQGKVLDAIKMHESHPSILKIKENVRVDTEFSFSPVSLQDIRSELKALSTKKATPFMGISAKQLKDVIHIIDKPLQEIWDREILGNKKFPSKLKLADISPIHKKLQTVLKGNYRPVSILHVVSKVFERIIDKQTDEYVIKYLSDYLCGYRKQFNPQCALLVMIEHWKKAVDNGEIAAGLLMDLSKAFDTINHPLMIAKLRAYGFDIASLEIIYDYLSDRWQRTKINSSFSTWSLILCGVPQGSVLGPKFFNIYLNDLFYLFVDTYVCNLADDTTPYAFNKDLPTLMRALEGDISSVMDWFEANFMILNAPKCHFLLSGPKTVVEHISVKVGEQVIWESQKEKLLGLIVDKQMKFQDHIKSVIKKASGKLSALTRLARILPFEQKRIVMNAFIESQFSNSSYPLIWMFCSKELNEKINSIHKRALRQVYSDFTSSFEELLEKDNSVTVHQRNIQLVAIEMFKATKDIGPRIVRDLFTLDHNENRDRNFSRPNINNKNTGENTIRYFGPIVWDEMLPNEFKTIETLENFKIAIKKWKPTNCPCSLCREYIHGVGYVTTYE
jgi:predicted transport protein